ncbi:MAG: hypothetical protein ACQKBY_00100 [Verrucomicrobiales bacterium]
MEIDCDLGYIIAEKTDLERYRQLLCAPPSDHRREICSALHGKIFTSVPNQGKGVRPLIIRRNSIHFNNETLEAPLMSGALRMRYASQIEDGNRISIQRLSASLHLNPTTAHNHLRERLTGEEPGSWETMLFKDSEYQQAFRLERGRDGKANLLPLAATLEESKNAIARHLRSSLQALLSEIVRARQFAKGSIGGNPRVESLTGKRIETYWEMTQPEALAFLESISPLLRTFHKETVYREHGDSEGQQKPAIDNVTQKNARSVRLHLGKGETITVYAKTHDRIRFEVCHHPKKQSNLLKGGYSCHSVEEFEEMMEFLQERAAKRINSLLAFLSEWQNETPNQRASSSHFASRWFQNLGFTTEAESLLEMLRVNGRIVGGSTLTEAERKALRTAKRKGLIFSDRGSLYPSKNGQSLTTNPISANKVAHESETQTVSSKSEIPLKSTTVACGMESHPLCHFCKAKIIIHRRHIPASRSAAPTQTGPARQAQ